jgi:hypothetical protein
MYWLELIVLGLASIVGSVALGDALSLREVLERQG